MKEERPLIVLLGPTASGKTKLAVSLAEDIDAEIISADSRQVYKDMDIGTGKDLNEYRAIPYHLIDIIPAGEQYNCAQFQADFQDALKGIGVKSKSAILCGGTGLYIQAVLQNYQHTSIPKNTKLRSSLDDLNTTELRKHLEGVSNPVKDTSTPRSKKQLIRAIEVRNWHEKQNTATEKQVNISPTFPFLIFGLSPSTSIRRDRISKRLQERINVGLLDEVEGLLKKGIKEEQLIFYGLEYKWAIYYLRDKVSYEEFYQKLEIAIHQFAKRQMTYFRKMEKDGLEIHWIDENYNLEDKVSFIKTTSADFMNRRSI